MKKQMFKSALTLTAAVVAGSAFAAVTTLYNEGFEPSEGWTIGDLVTTDAQWTASGANDASVIASGNGGQVLELKTEGDTLTNTLSQANASSANTAISGGEPVTFEAEVKFVPSDSLVTDLPQGTDDTKFALYAYAPDGGPTNLVVYHANDFGEGTEFTNEVIDVNGALNNPEAFKTVSVKIFNTEGDGLFFTVTLDGTLLESTVVDDYNDPNEEGSYPMSWFKTVNGDDPADAQLSAICFKGTGAVDNLAVKTGKEDVATTVTVTLNAGTLSAVGLTTNGVAVVGDPLPTSIVVPTGTAIAYTVANADGAQKTVTTTAGDSDSTLDASGETFGWPEYLGEAVSSAYEIDSLAELKLFQKGVAAGLATSNETFKLTADVTLDIAWPGIGIQNGKDIYTTAEFDAGAFCGTFDGQNHTVSGFQMVGRADNPANAGKQESEWEGLDYCGFFNSTYGATIQNLKIQYAGSLFAIDTTSATKESGATFVGVAKNSTLRNLTTVAGTVSCSKGFGGIVGYLTYGTTVDSCTNNVNMTSLANNKCGGIAMIAQGGSAVSISNCQNNGTQTTSSLNSEYGAIVGYVGLDITIANCETTVGRFLKHQGNTVITLQGVNKGDARVVSYHGTATPGLNFAIVDGNVATFVADNALAAGNIYKVMGPSATATFEFAAAGTIAFDTALATPTYAITAPGLKLSDSTSGTVKTYTAVAYAHPTVTVTGGANATAAWTVNGSPAAEAPATLTEGDTYEVTFTANLGYEFAADATTTFSGTAGTENITIAAPDATAVAPAGFDGGDGVATFDIPAATQTALAEVLPSGKTLADVADADSDVTYAQAYALGILDEQTGDVDPLNAEITFNADGKPVVELDANAGAAYSVTCKLYGSTTLPVDTTGEPIATAALGEDLVDQNASGATKFYKVVVVIENAQE